MKQIIIKCLEKLINFLKKDTSQKNPKLKKQGLSREVVIQNMQVKPYTDTSVSDYEPPKPVKSTSELEKAIDDYNQWVVESSKKRLENLEEFYEKLNILNK